MIIIYLHLFRGVGAGVPEASTHSDLGHQYRHEYLQNGDIT